MSDKSKDNGSEPMEDEEVESARPPPIPESGANRILYEQSTTGLTGTFAETGLEVKRDACLNQGLKGHFV